MRIYKIARTEKSPHIGQLYHRWIDVRYAKEKLGDAYHIYERRRDRKTGKIKWFLELL